MAIDLNTITTIDEASELIRECHCGGVGFVRLPFPPGHPLFGEAIPCLCWREEAARRRARIMRERAGLKAVGECYTFETFDPMRCVPLAEDGPRVQQEMARVKLDCMLYANALNGWLVLAGVYGSGKTHLAYAIANRALENGTDVLLGTCADLLDALRKSFQDNTYSETFDTMKNVRLLVIDDLGAQSPTPWVNEKLLQVINYRLEARLPLVVTTNVDLRKRDQTAIDPRLVSRLMSGTGVDGGWTRYIILPAGDFRPQVKRAFEGGKLDESLTFS